MSDDTPISLDDARALRAQKSSMDGKAPTRKVVTEAELPTRFLSSAAMEKAKAHFEHINVLRDDVTRLLTTIQYLEEGLVHFLEQSAGVSLAHYTYDPHRGLLAPRPPSTPPAALAPPPNLEPA